MAFASAFDGINQAGTAPNAPPVHSQDICDNDVTPVDALDKDKIIENLRKQSDHDATRLITEERDQAVAERDAALKRWSDLRIQFENEKRMLQREMDKALAEMAAASGTRASSQPGTDRMHAVSGDFTTDSRSKADCAICETLRLEVDKLKYITAEKIKVMEERDKAVQKCEELQREVDAMHELAKSEQARLTEERDRAMKLCEEIRNEKSRAETMPPAPPELTEDSEREGLLGKCDSMQQQLSTFAQSLEASARDRDEACAERDRLLEEKMYILGVCDKLRQEVERLNMLVGNAQLVSLQMSESQEERDRALEDSKLAMSRCEELMRESEAQQHMFGDMREERDRAVARCKVLEIERDDEFKKRYKAEKDKEAAQREREQTLSELVALKQEQEKIRNDKNVIQAECMAAQEKARALTRQLEEAKREGGAVSEALLSLRQSFEGLNQRLQEADTERIDLRTRYSVLSADREALVIRAELVESKIEALRTCTQQKEDLAAALAAENSAKMKLAASMLSAWSEISAVSRQLAQEITALGEQGLVEREAFRTRVVRAKAQVLRMPGL
jgi:hypothetical protein